VPLNAAALRRNLAARQGNVSQAPNSTQRSNAIPPNSSRKIPSAKVEQPNSSDAEMGVLGSMLLDPKSAIPEASRGCQPWFFYNPVRRTIFETLRDFWDSGATVDLITYTQFLRDKGILDQIGGPAFVTELATFVPSCAALSHYIGIVREKAMLRELISA